jgi:hypothetical protein
MSPMAMNLPTNLCDGVTPAQDGALVIGVLALHGGYHEHKVMLSRLGCMVREIRQVCTPPATPSGLAHAWSRECCVRSKTA